MMMKPTLALPLLALVFLALGCSSEVSDNDPAVATEETKKETAAESSPSSAPSVEPVDSTKTPEGDDEGWITLFDGVSLDGWKANEHPESWSVEDGMIVGHGVRSHLFYMDREFTDVEFKAEIWLRKGSNSGMYFRTEFGPAWPKGYEAQVNNSHGDPVRTGSLYNMVKITEQLIDDETWWEQTVICKGNHIVIKVNDEVVVDFVDENNTYKKGYLALQQHDPGSEVHYRNLMARPLN